MREGWKEVKFGDVAQFSPKIKMVKGTSYPFIPMEELSSGIKYVKPIQERELSGGGAKFEEGDTLFARITPCLQNGKIAQVKNLNNKPGFGSTEYFIFRGINEISESDFIYYLSQTEEFRENAINSMVGASGRQRADAGHVKKFQFLLPPLETQRKIASILSGYDDLIENNLKRIKILEEMAQQTYEEWFVRMRFPGYETEVMNEETGLPEVWEKVKLGDLCDKIFDGTHDSPKQSEFGYKLITGKHLQKGKVDFETAYFISEEDHFKIKKRSELTKGDIMYSNIGTIGNLSMVYEDFEYSCKNMIVFRPKHNLQYFVYTYLFNENTKNKIIGEASGSTQKFISLGYIRNYEDYFPSLNFITDFSEYCNPIYKKINNLNKQNQRLREARDLLLPRLMMGIVEV